MAQTEEKPEFFPPIADVVDKTHAGDEDIGARPLEEIESLCMECGEQGVTRMMLTSIPFFREVIVMSFRCEHCGHSNNEIQSAGKIRSEGTIYTVKVLNRGDLDRQLIRSESCSINIPEFQLVLPPSRGQLTTVEGLLRDIVADLSGQQPLRRIQDENAYAKIQEIIDGLKAIIADDEDEGKDELEKRELSNEDPVSRAITITLDDPSGNSFLEFVGSMSDLKWNMRTYERSLEQNQQLGLAPPSEDAEKNAADEAEQGPNEEVFEFPGICSRCARPLITRMKKVSIPYFKDTLIMSTNCDNCGYRDNEIKSGSAISEQGKKITLKVEDRDDLSRDILKSDTSGLSIPEIDLVLHPGTLGGRFTTLEGILDQVYEELSEKVFNAGDSGVVDVDDRAEFQEFLRKLKQVKNAEIPFTLILDDPLANSHVQNLYAPDPDPNMEIVTYERTWQQNEDLGLNDMNVESYSGDDTKDSGTQLEVIG
ncbi:zf-ZPR1-domain-containing protein [Suillus clintonianus]|uniref:zf-ZPR1-domain-containing protein n=1 Tax=Suillus clintonianus TaxID=1904413 RepID=UPI001B871C4E|nr:zf-ZPR1-domain-containing protein [Suillus clintonianus]KAG2141297.1 zf-ZPR1-domain-containing protein [Suillus clintonianus]